MLGGTDSWGNWGYYVSSYKGATVTAHGNGTTTKPSVSVNGPNGVGVSSNRIDKTPNCSTCMDSSNYCPNASTSHPSSGASNDDDSTDTTYEYTPSTTDDDDDDTDSDSDDDDSSTESTSPYSLSASSTGSPFQAGDTLTLTLSGNESIYSVSWELAESPQWSGPISIYSESGGHGSYESSASYTFSSGYPGDYVFKAVVYTQGNMTRYEHTYTITVGN